MSLEEKIRSVEELFACLDQEIKQFKGWSGLDCLKDCVRCCTKENIEATILEFLPFAYHLYQKGKALEFHQLLEASPKGICQVFNPLALDGAFCSEYLHRGLICRLFGFSARLNKYNLPELITCQEIKFKFPDAIQAVQQIQQPEKFPILAHHYMRLKQIDWELSREFYPLNVAIKKALEMVIQYFSYRETG